MELAKRQIRARLIKNAAANVYAQGTATLLPLISIPLFLHFWSKQYYGEWLLLSSAASYLSLAEAGFSTQAANEVSMHIARRDFGSARRSLHTAWGFLVGISSIATLVAAYAAFACPWKRILNLREIRLIDSEVIILCLALYTVVGLLMAILTAHYRAAYRNHRFGLIGTSGKLLEVIAVTISLIAWRSMLLVAVAMLTIRIGLVIAMFYDASRLTPELRVGFREFSIDELGRSWRPSVLFMALSLASALYLQGMTQLVGKLMGAEVVVAFIALRALSRGIVQTVSVIKHSAWPELSYFFGKGDLEGARRLNGLALEASWIATMLLSGVIIWIGPWFLSLWTHNAVKADRVLIAVFLASAATNGLWFVTSGLLMSINKHEGLAVLYGIASVVGFACGWPAISRYGIYGAGYSMFLCELIVLPFAIISVAKLLGLQTDVLLGQTAKLTEIRKLISQLRPAYQRWKNAHATP